MSNSAEGAHSGEGFDWRPIRLVVFDLDGTLYPQRPLRMRMAARLCWHAATRLDLSAIKVLRTYRRLRERFGEAETEGFESKLRAEVGAAHRLTPSEVGAIIETWIDEKPLALLRGYSRLPGLFAGIRRSGRKLAVLSDYPCAKKLAALGLSADRALAAEEVGFLKPHPAGLQRLMNEFGARPAETVLVGDRPERDGEAARRAGAKALILSRKSRAGWTTFSSYRDPVFDEFFETSSSVACLDMAGSAGPAV
jgi:putative hydrolase of the HAD superfamily